MIKKSITGLFLNLLAVPIGFSGYLAMYLGSEIYEVTIPWIISILLTIGGIVAALNSLLEIRKAERNESVEGVKYRGLMKAVSYIAIGVGIINCTLPIIYWNSY